MFEGFDGWLRAKDENGEERPYSVSEFIDHCNAMLGRDFDDVLIEGEVSSFKVNQGKWVFFDLKDNEFSVSCFMVLSQLTTAITDGMKVRVRAVPKVTRWGKFSLTIRQVMPVGEGNIKKSFELLKKKLTLEGLFDPARKRSLPPHICEIGVISSTSAAGYIDFLKILDNRWGGLKIKTVNTQVQGLAAPGQIIRALNYFNECGGVDVIAILRGGGSADDLAAFNDEALARTIAASKIPVITGIGHEVDESLADLAADVRASTPSNAAERLTPDKSAIARQAHLRVEDARRYLLNKIDLVKNAIQDKITQLRTEIASKIDQDLRHIAETRKILESLNPENVLRRGYAIIAGKQSPGSEITITTERQILTAEITNVQKRP